MDKIPQYSQENKFEVEEIRIYQNHQKWPSLYSYLNGK